MSWAGKIFWLVSIVALLILITSRVFLGGWISILFIPLLMFVISFVAALVVDIRFYAEFLTLRTTKHGMNMGVMIILALVLLVAVNFLSVMNNKTIDITKNKMNTLAPESIKVAESIDENFEILTFYRGEKDHAKKLSAKLIFSRFKNLNSNIKTYYINSYTDNLKTKAELGDIVSGDDIVSIIKFSGKKIQIDNPINESNILSGIIRATRKNMKSIYFLTGHGERSLTEIKSGGILNLANLLASKSYKVKELNLLNTNVTVPPDAEVIAILGPQVKFFENEITALKAFASTGGRLLIAADPGQSHNINELLTYFGLVFRDNYIIAEVAEMLGRSPTTALGIQFDRTSEITKNIEQDGQIYSVFELASELVTVNSSEDSEYSYLPLIATPDKSFTIEELKIKVTPGVRAAKVLSIQVNKNKSKAPTAVVFGDSDFLTNKDLSSGINKRIALNAISYLAGESDLISIPKKEEAGTKLIMTDRLRNSVVMAGLFLPMLLLIFSGILFYRRKGA